MRGRELIWELTNRNRGSALAFRHLPDVIDLLGWRRRRKVSAIGTANAAI